MRNDGDLAHGQPLAVVTGASRGLGRALSVAFTRRGVQVAGLARCGRKLAETGRLCGPARFTSYVADVSDPERIRTVFADIETRMAPVAILVNNAAIYPRVPFLMTPAERILEQLTINLNGYISCASAALHYMVKRGEGRIINISSFAGDSPTPGSLGYSVSKGGDRIFTQALAAETRDRLPGITVSEWMPGILATDMGNAHGIDPAVAAEWGVALALDRSAAMHGATFLKDRELLEPQGRLSRWKSRLLRIPQRQPVQL